MAKGKRYDVLHTFAGTIDGKRTWFTRRNQQDVALLDADTRDGLIANGRVREYDAPDEEPEKVQLDGSLETARLNRQARATSVPVAMQDAQGEDEVAGPVRRSSRKAKKVDE